MFLPTIPIALKYKVILEIFCEARQCYDVKCNGLSSNEPSGQKRNGTRQVMKAISNRKNGPRYYFSKDKMEPTYGRMK